MLDKGSVREITEYHLNKMQKVERRLICWKVVKSYTQRRRWRAPYQWNRTYQPGWNISSRVRKIYKGDEYIPYFHAFMYRSAAERQLRGWGALQATVMVRCEVYPEDVTVVGKQFGGWVLVAKKIWIPPYPKTER